MGLHLTGVVNYRATIYFIMFLRIFTRLMYCEIRLGLKQPKSAGNGLRLNVKR